MPVNTCLRDGSYVPLYPDHLSNERVCSMRNFMKSLAVAALCLAATQAQAAESLRRYNIDITSTTVSGLSSGAFMAQQFHFAESDIVSGAAIIAGGPYYCARGRLVFATDKCMQPKVGGGPSADESLQAAANAERRGL